MATAAAVRARHAAQARTADSPRHCPTARPSSARTAPRASCTPRQLRNARSRRALHHTRSTARPHARGAAAAASELKARRSAPRVSCTRQPSTRRSARTRAAAAVAHVRHARARARASAVNAMTRRRAAASCCAASAQPRTMARSSADAHAAITLRSCSRVAARSAATGRRVCGSVAGGEEQREACGGRGGCGARCRTGCGAGCGAAPWRHVLRARTDWCCSTRHTTTCSLWCAAVRAIQLRQPRATSRCTSRLATLRRTLPVREASAAASRHVRSACTTAAPRQRRSARRRAAVAAATARSRSSAAVSAVLMRRRSAAVIRRCSRTSRAQRRSAPRAPTRAAFTLQGGERGGACLERR